MTTLPLTLLLAIPLLALSLAALAATYSYRAWRRLIRRHGPRGQA